MTRFKSDKLAAIGLSALLAISLFLPQSGSLVAATDGEPAQVVVPAAKRSATASPSFPADMELALKQAERLLYNQKPFPDWAAVGFAKNGHALPDGFKEAKADLILHNRGEFDKLTDLTRTTIAYAAAGGSSINDIAGIDLYTKAMNHPAMTEEGMTGLVSAYVVSTLYQWFSPFARTAWYSDRLLSRIQSEQLSTGSWPDKGSKKGSVTSNALALIALSPQQSEFVRIGGESVMDHHRRRDSLFETCRYRL
ncbi:hypothetical protein [Paenibacillus methanolicus]|uniref:Alginate lyase domain-containing protein n=1 Tax=Paenibacillus methanolicus TaxID=582686 RepID=A0A5S5C4E3_9BACL|nr:hypothetical protein [Paenibacillus methanolicus]TYP73286.1 hypothetical protein BCM02_107270 [Paenibacillus methanolicus]